MEDLTETLIQDDDLVEIALLNEEAPLDGGDDEIELKPRNGFLSPAQSEYGHDAQVISIPQDLRITQPEGNLSIDPFIAQANRSVSASAGINQRDGVTIIDIPEVDIDEPPVPSIVVRPSIQINDTVIHGDQGGTFTITSDFGYPEDLVLQVTYPNDIFLEGANFNPETGELVIPAGTTEVTLDVSLSPMSTIEPSGLTQIMLTQGDGPLVHFIDSLGQAQFFELLPSFDIEEQHVGVEYEHGSGGYHLTFVIDVSSSMLTNAPDGLNRLDRAKHSMIEILEGYEQVTDNLEINIIPFSSNPNNQGAFVYTATSMDDAKAYILGSGSHSDDGIEVRMMNPNTGGALGRGTHYNDALYHARTQIESDLVNPEFSEHAFKVYFISDGQPNDEHSATDTDLWPQTWGPWHQFITNPKDEIPNSFISQIDCFAVSIGNELSVIEALEEVATNHDYIFSTQSELESFSEKLFQTLPAYHHVDLIGELHDASSTLSEIWFYSPDANQYILDHHLDEYGALAFENNQQVHIFIDQNEPLAFELPSGASAIIDDAGDLYYLGNNEYGFDRLDYTFVDPFYDEPFDASLNIYHAPYQATIGHINEANDQGNIHLPSEGDLVIVQSPEDTNLIIDLAAPIPTMVVAVDVIDTPDSTINFKNTQTLHLSDVLIDASPVQDGHLIDTTLLSDQGESRLLLVSDAPLPLSTYDDVLSYLSGHITMELH